MSGTAYEWVARKFACDPTKLGKLLEEIDQRDGRVTAEAVVRAAKPKRSPIHRVVFALDDESAAQQHRLNVAMKLIVAVRRVDASTQAPQYVHVPKVEHAGIARGYFSQERLSSPDIRAAVLEEALSYLNGARKRWGIIEDLAGVWEAVDAAVAKSKRGKLHEVA